MKAATLIFSFLLCATAASTAAEYTISDEYIFLNDSIDEVVVKAAPFRPIIDSPVSVRSVSRVQIEKSPGANRDVSRVVQSYPGVSYSPAGYRNDLIVRGGSPAENRFFVDGIEIPNINHFSTQGASGGPVSIVNADLLQGLNFYSSAFPVQYSGALSSVIDMRLRDGDTLRQNFKFTVGASEIALSGDGHFSPKTTYIFSVRQSYLQYLFSALGLPILPNFIDATFKVKHKLSERNELLLLAVMGFDKLKLNEEGEDESAEYILGYLPTINQQSITTGLSYRHFRGDTRYTLTASHSYLNNENIKYQDNDESNPEALLLNLKARDQKTTIRGEERAIKSGGISTRYGAEISYTQYDINSFQRNNLGTNIYSTHLDLFSYGVFASLSYMTASKSMSFALGTRFDANNFSSETRRIWEQFSPRIAATYYINDELSTSAAFGVYHTMPPLTALSYKQDGVSVNKNLDYIRVLHYTLGAKWKPKRNLQLSIEGFYKQYANLPTSLDDNIPLSDLGNDYGTIGNEALSGDGTGRAYGVEFLGVWRESKKLSLIGSLTIYRSEYSVDGGNNYRPSTWDSRFIANCSGIYTLKRGWSLGAKLSATGAAPYTPYDLSATAEIINWDLTGKPVFDYSQYNSLRLDSYAQLDLRIDKTYDFKKWTLGLYIDVQNISGSAFVQADIPVSDGTTNDGVSYNLKYLESKSDTLLPTIGVSIEF